VKAQIATITYHVGGSEYAFLDTTPVVREYDVKEVVAAGGDLFKNISPISFAGWALTGIAGDSVTYSEGDSITMEAGENLALYAVWTPCADITVCGLLKVDAPLTDEEGFSALYDPSLSKLVLSNSLEGINEEGITSADDAYAWFRICNYGYADSGNFKVRVKVDDQYFTEGITRWFDNENTPIDIPLEEGGLIEGGVPSDGYALGSCIVRIDIGKLLVGEHEITIELDYENDVAEASGWADEDIQAGGKLDNVLTVTESVSESIGFTVTYNPNFELLTSVVFEEPMVEDVVTTLKSQEVVMSEIDIVGAHYFLESEIINYVETYYGQTVGDYSNLTSNGFVFWGWLDVETSDIYLPGDPVTKSLDLVALWDYMPQLWFWPVNETSPESEDVEYIQMTQVGQVEDGVLYNTLENVLTFNAVNYNCDYISAPEFAIDIEVKNTATSE